MYYLLLTEYEFISSQRSYIIRGDIQTIVTLTTGPPSPLKLLLIVMTYYS